MVLASRVDLFSFLRETTAPNSDLARILYRFADAAKKVQKRLATAPIEGLIGSTGETNVQKEIVAKMDNEANLAFLDYFGGLPNVRALVSEEDKEPAILSNKGRYTLCFDPLDGSSNIGVAPVGSILGVYDLKIPVENERVLIKGHEQIAAAFTVYGIPTMLVLTIFGLGVWGFTLNPESEEWVLTHPDIKLPKPKYSSVNWMYADKWSTRVKAGVKAASTGLKGRYSGSLVEDILRILFEGGIFFYPEDSESSNGKLRMLYENAPIGLIVKQAGGLATSGEKAIEDITITDLHQRSAFIAGNQNLVNLYSQTYTS